MSLPLCLSSVAAGWAAAVVNLPLPAVWAEAIAAMAVVVVATGVAAVVDLTMSSSAVSIELVPRLPPKIVFLHVGVLEDGLWVAQMLLNVVLVLLVAVVTLDTVVADTDPRLWS